MQQYGIPDAEWFQFRPIESLALNSPWFSMVSILSKSGAISMRKAL